MGTGGVLPTLREWGQFTNMSRSLIKQTALYGLLLFFNSIVCRIEYCCSFRLRYLWIWFFVILTKGMFASFDLQYHDVIQGSGVGATQYLRKINGEDDGYAVPEEEDCVRVE